LGNVAVVLAQQHEDPALFQEAIDYYSQVVLRYEASRDELYRADTQDIAATAYMGLGAAYQRQDDLERARQNYERCADTTSAPQMRQRCIELIQVVETLR
jgi:tetratricopeptide (TPR) repeat protein